MFHCRSPGGARGAAATPLEETGTEREAAIAKVLHGLHKLRHSALIPWHSFLWTLSVLPWSKRKDSRDVAPVYCSAHRHLHIWCSPRYLWTLYQAKSTPSGALVSRYWTRDGDQELCLRLSVRTGHHPTSVALTSATQIRNIMTVLLSELQGTMLALTTSNSYVSSALKRANTKLPPVHMFRCVSTNVTAKHRTHARGVILYSFSLEIGQG
jgi:hypothetical protein